MEITTQFVSPTVEEYLENIYRLEEQLGVARTKRLAEVVKVSLGTITNTIESLKKQGFVIHEPYKGVKLTESGRKIALDVIRRHRLSERLLTDYLKIDQSKVHVYACKFEHVVTDEITKQLEKVLGHPTTCPHGNPIPTKCGGILRENSQPLDTLCKGDECFVVKIINEQQELLEYLQTLSLFPGSRIRVVEKAPFEGPITVKVNGEIYPLSRNIAALIWVNQEVHQIGETSD